LLSSIMLEVPRPLRSRRCPLQRLFSAFPNGFPGGGLLLLRFVVALNAAAEGIFILSSPDHETASCWYLAGLAVVMSGSILMGFLTPICCGLAAVANVIINVLRLPALASSIGHLNLAIICIALALLGPGAFSVDARLFGRREIIIPDSKRDQP
jgi:putative oxidoreductase